MLKSLKSVSYSYYGWMEVNVLVLPISNINFQGENEKVINIY